MYLKWSVPRYKDSVFPRLGGLHIAMNFMMCIGDHMNGSGVHEIWVESDLLGPIAAEQVLSGKHYNRAMRAHKITSQALWRLLLPPLLGFLKDSDREIYDEIIAIKTDHVSIELVVEMLQTDAVRQKIAEFKATSNSQV
jgi:hypothetical protein